MITDEDILFTLPVMPPYICNESTMSYGIYVQFCDIHIFGIIIIFLQRKYLQLLNIQLGVLSVIFNIQSELPGFHCTYVI